MHVSLFSLSICYFVYVIGFSLYCDYSRPPFVLPPSPSSSPSPFSAAAFTFTELSASTVAVHFLLHRYRHLEDKMASNQDDTHDGSGSRNNVEKEIKRGLTVMKSIIRARDKGEKFEVHWSAEDQLIEPNDSMLASYIGFLVRQHIPITCDNWRNPELKVGKEKIWSEIQRSFHIDESRQKYCIQLAGKRL
ncbi:hypothetical protein KIW84_072373 [Lathyrus oleraceus]|uniref:Uncharacterized protein n=1 Tax=Pisum sativum TaxID=3888 RepID=A0A9D4ZV15_PEA|nr:hypothetical protein KIW84_072373 [Pisum sativum]